MPLYFSVSRNQLIHFSAVPEPSTCPARLLLSSLPCFVLQEVSMHGLQTLTPMPSLAYTPWSIGYERAGEESRWNISSLVSFLRSVVEHSPPLKPLIRQPSPTISATLPNSSSPTLAFQPYRGQKPPLSLDPRSFTIPCWSLLNLPILL